MKQIDIEGFKLQLRSEKDWGFWQNGFYEPEETELIKSIIKPNDICLDIGANIGYFTILMAKLGAIVYSFEPEPSNFDMLNINIKLNNIGDIWTYFVAVGQKEEQKILYLSDINNGMHRLYKSKWATFGQTETNVIKLDDMGLPKIDFIKMDVEGAELPALKGMKELLNKYHPTIIMEFHPMSIKESGAHPREIYDFLKSLDYEITLIPYYHQPIEYLDLINATSDESGGRNILCQKIKK